MGGKGLLRAGGESLLGERVTATSCAHRTAARAPPHAAFKAAQRAPPGGRAPAPPRGVFRGGTRPFGATPPSSAVKPGEPPWLLPLPPLPGAQCTEGCRSPLPRVRGALGSLPPSPGCDLLQGFAPTRSPRDSPSPLAVSGETAGGTIFSVTQRML